MCGYDRVVHHGILLGTLCLQFLSLMLHGYRRVRQCQTSRTPRFP